MLSTEERIEVVGRAADGGEAVRMARQLEPDVVALDISMPVMDGFEAAAELERLAHPPAVLMLTGSSAPEDIDRARRVGAKGYITKDAIAARLVDAILARPPRAVESARAAATLFRAMLQVSAVFQVIVSVALLALILMHSGRDAGLGGHGLHARLPGRHAHRRAEPDEAHRRRRDGLLPQQRRALPTARLRSKRARLHCSSPRWWRNW